MAEFTFLKPALPLSADHVLFNQEVEERVLSLQLPDKYAWIFRLAIADEKANDEAKAVTRAIIVDYDANIKNELFKAQELLKTELIIMQSKKKSFLDIAQEHL